MLTHQNTGAPAKHLKPLITLTANDHERLSGLVRAAMNNMPDMASGLADEIERAHVMAKGRHPIDVVSMGSEVKFRDDTSGKIQKVFLVYPGQADISQDKISVLTPIGTALIGLQVGSSITWETRTGELKRLTVLEVREAQPA
jgi:regulator of nucleoside diphosphate kinase